MRKLALLFPGQGSQYVGMCKNFFKKSSMVRETFEEANDVLGFDLQGLCFDGSIDDFGTNSNA